MVDAVGTIAKIVEVALKIKGAAETVKQNEDVCKQIKSRVEILGNTLSQHQNNTELMSNLAVRYSLEALDEILVEAFKLVMDCQEETNFVCLFYTAGKLSRELIQVEQRISSRNIDAILAIMGFLLPKQSNQDGANPQSPSQQGVFVCFWLLIIGDPCMPSEEYFSSPNFYIEVSYPVHLTFLVSA